MKELALINPENASEEEVKTYHVREAARAIVVDENSMIALLHVSKKNYYKLPGGGLDDKEDILTALGRECQEEIGCDVEVINEIGSIVEYIKISQLKQISYCYLTKVQGEKGTPHFEESELEDGFKQVWLSYQDAIAALTGSKATDFSGSAYIVPRDIFLLEEAKKHFDDFVQ